MAQVLKRGSPAFSVPQEDVVLKVLDERARECYAEGGLQVVTDDVYGLKVIPDMRYQRLNASLALSLTTEYLQSEDPIFRMSETLISSLEAVKLPGRCQMLQGRHNTWYISVATMSLVSRRLRCGLGPHPRSGKSPFELKPVFILRFPANRKYYFSITCLTTHRLEIRTAYSSCCTKNSDSMRVPL
jgi:hypothetical protein